MAFKVSYYPSVHNSNGRWVVIKQPWWIKRIVYYDDRGRRNVKFVVKWWAKYLPHWQLNWNLRNIISSYKTRKAS